MRWNQKYDRDKMFTLVEEYLSGGIMQKDLCQRESIKKGTFKYWQRKYREESKGNSSKKASKKKKVITSDFIPISVPVVPIPSSCELELVYPNGVRLHLNTVMDATGLSTLKELVLCLD